ncbi:unnamed protein product, partial [Amoebophrya sp. A25]
RTLNVNLLENDDSAAAAAREVFGPALRRNAEAILLLKKRLQIDIDASQNYSNNNDPAQSTTSSSGANLFRVSQSHQGQVTSLTASSTTAPDPEPIISIVDAKFGLRERIEKYQATFKSFADAARIALAARNTQGMAEAEAVLLKQRVFHSHLKKQQQSLVKETKKARRRGEVSKVVFLEYRRRELQGILVDTRFDVAISRQRSSLLTAAARAD